MAKIEYVVCPLCGRNRVLKLKDKGEARFPGYESTKEDFSVDYTPMLQVREGGGRGSGFNLLPGDSFTLSEMLDKEEYKDLLADLAGQVKKLYDSFVELNLIEAEERF